MKRFVEGSYSTQETANLAVETLVSRGYKKSDMTFIANQAAAQTLADFPGVRILVVESGQDNENGLWAKVKDLFSRDNNAIDLIKDDELLSQYEHKLDQGDILLLVESGLDDRQGDTLKDKVDDDHTLDSAAGPNSDGRRVIIPPAGTTDHTNMNSPGYTGIIPPIVDVDDDNEERTR